MDAVLAILPVNFFTEPPPPPNKAFPPDQAPATPREPNRSALALAILGWQGLLNAKGGSVPNSSSCHTCLRRLGLWMFKSKEVDVETNTVLVPAVMDNLDPLREHRFFCPWKNGAAQRNPGAKPLPSGEEHKAAWEILVQMIGNEAYVRNRVSSAHGRSKSSAARPSGSATPTSQRLRTPGRPTTASGPGANGIPPFDLLGPTRPDVVDVDDEETRRKKDQAMFARLRRVKSLFNTKGANKLKRSSLLPGTGHSNVGGEQA